MRTDEFDYLLPSQAIAQQPLDSRSAARLLRVSDLSDHTVADLPTLLEPGDTVVVNSTKVRHARLAARRVPSGGAVEVLLLGMVADGSWEAMVRPARRLRAGERLTVDDRIHIELLSDPVDGIVRADVVVPDDANVEAVIEEVGVAPLPPYIRTRLDRPERYQTMFAERVGSAAAPTAGLHFTEDVVAALGARDISVVEVELRVGLDTFRPITTDDIGEHQIHTEWCAVSASTAQTVNHRRAAGGRVVAVGTTVMRTLESYAEDGEVVVGEGPTSLYITPGYRFGVVDLLMTNFHVPRSSLLVLVAAFAGSVWRDAYAAALERGYRFLSFGDAMLLERA